MRQLAFKKGLIACGVLSIAFIIAPAHAVDFNATVDYTPTPTPPNLKRDEATSLFVDLSIPKKQADFSAGQADIGLKPSGFTNGAYRGILTIPVSQVFDGKGWTIEMILRVPAEAGTNDDPISLGGWPRPKGKAHQFGMTLRQGASFAVTGRGPTSPFKLESHAGGSGLSFAKDAPGQWIYLTFGLDLEHRRASAVARGMDGFVLKKKMAFSKMTDLNPESWKEILEVYQKSLPNHFTLGNNRVELRAVRISNRFRPEVALVHGSLTDREAWVPFATSFTHIEGKVFTATDLDPTKVVTLREHRWIGYNPSNRAMVPLEEKVLSLAPGEKVAVTLKNLPIGLYGLFLYGTVDPKGREELERVWQPAPMEFEVKNSGGKRTGWGRLLLKQSFRPRMMQGFHFHVDVPGDYTATFTLMKSAKETPRIQQIFLVDTLKDLPNEAVKQEQLVEVGTTNQLTTLTEARKQRDDRIWNAFIPLNVHTAGGWQEFDHLPKDFKLPNWKFKDNRNHFQVGGGAEAFLISLDIINKDTGEVLSQDRVRVGDPLPGTPTDDGTGIFLRKADHPDLPHDVYACPRAKLMLARGLEFMGAIAEETERATSAQSSQARLGPKYAIEGNVEAGHDGAMALVRLAYDFPALEYGLQEIRNCTHHPDLEFKKDYSYIRGGKLINWSWSAEDVRALILNYDQLFPYIHDNQIFAQEVHRFIPWINTPQDVVKFLDRQLVFAALRDVDRGFLRSNRNIQEAAGEVLGPHPLTADLFDLTKQSAEYYPIGGTFQEMYATGLSRVGAYYAGSYLAYALGDAQKTIQRAYGILAAKKGGLAVKMDLSDVQKYPKVRGAGNFLVDMWVAGGFPFMIGDASGGPHTGRIAYQRINEATLKKAFSLYRDPQHAWILKNKFGSTDPEVTKAAEGQPDPILHDSSRVVPIYGAIVEMNPEESDVTKKTGATLRVGIGQAHTHADYLDLNLYAMGLPMAVDLACRSEGNQWSRPAASFSFLHNHAMAHETDDPKGAGGQNGEPWFRAFAPPLVRGRYVDESGEIQLDRDLLFMEVGNTGTYYVFDVQRLKGGKLHTWCFHGCESDDLQLNVPMEQKTVRWIDRTLEGTHKVGTATNMVQGVWTMTREKKEIPHKFMKGGTIKTVACEPVVLGNLYDASKPPARIRATLLGHSGEQVLQGSPYSEPYGYCFPFLWVQGAAKAESVYPALYEWYRGETPVIAKAELVSQSPLMVRVTTTSGQVDEYVSDAEKFSAISSDANGLRWAKFNGMAQFQSKDVSFKAAAANRQATIVEIDYATRKLKTSGRLPSDPGVVAGNLNRWCWLDLKGSDTSFTWDDDLLVCEGEISGIKIKGDDQVEITANQKVLFEGAGNRKLAAFTTSNEDGTWQFRNGKVIKRPPGAKLTPAVFTDANADGLIDLKTYEIGLGDTLEVPSDITLRCTTNGYEVKTNVGVKGAVGGKPFEFEPKSDWQRIL